MSKFNQSSLLLLLIVVIMSSCGVNKDLMFKTPTEYEFDEVNITDTTEYTISINDRLRFRLFTNDGFKIIDLVGSENQQGGNSNLYRQPAVSYLVELDGTAKLPTLGRTLVVGMNIKEAEDFLEEKYREFYRDPFVILEVINKRAIVSTGEGGLSRVVLLENNNVTLIEALSLAGGIADRGNSSRIKIIRHTPEGREIYHVDLSTIDGIAMADMIIQANDIIYVEPVPRLAQEILLDVAPIVSLLTSAFVIINFIATN